MKIKRDRIVIINDYKTKNKNILNEKNMIKNNGQQIKVHDRSYLLTSFCQKIQHYKYFCKNNNSKEFILTFKNNKCFSDLGYFGSLSLKNNILFCYWNNEQPCNHSKFIFQHNYTEIKVLNSDGTMYLCSVMKNKIENKVHISNHKLQNTKFRRIYYVVSTYNIDKQYALNFLENNKNIFDENSTVLLISDCDINNIPKYKFKVEVIIYPEKQKIFSIGRTINYGIRKLETIKNDDIIIKTDIDILFSNELIEYLKMYLRIKQPIICVPHYINKEQLIRTNNSAYWVSCSKDMESKGACFAMTKYDWFTLKGYDERIEGWGGDDTELYLRSRKIFKNTIVSLKFPLYHINHPSRINGNFIFNQKENIKYLDRLDWSDNNWGKIIKTKSIINSQVKIQPEKIIKSNNTIIQTESVLNKATFKIINNYNCRISNIKNNNYQQYENILKTKTITPKKKVSIVIPTYNRKDLLKIHLEALKHQTYPLDLIEVIIADDGSSDKTKTMIKKSKYPFSLKYITQKDLGYRLSKIRNEAIKIATNEIIIISDVDMIPVKDYVFNHMKWHHICDNCAIIGHRKYVDPSNIIYDKIKKDSDYLYSVPDTIHKRLNITKDWRLKYYNSSNMLKSHREPWLYLCGGNVSFKKEHCFQVGLFDEDFTFWGGEDQEFAYKLYKHGVYMIPELKALALHVEHPVNIKQQNENQLKARKLLEKKKIEFNKIRFFEQPDVTIFIPVYNRERFLDKTIQSAINQSYKNIEILLCDDGSTDNSFYIIQQYMKKYNKPNRRPLIRCIKKNKNLGIANTWNLCFRYARGKYLLQLDGDDYIDKITTSTLKNLMNEKVVISFAGYSKVASNGQNLHQRVFAPFSKDVLFNVGNCVSPPRMFNKKYYFYTDGCNENYINSVDYDMCAKIAHHGIVKHIEKYLYFYRQHGKQTTIEHSTKQKENHKQVILMCRNWKFKYKKFYQI